MGATSSRCEFTGPPGLDFNQKFAVVARAYPSNWSGDDPAFPSTGPAPLPIGPNQRRFAAELTNFPAQPVRLIAFGTLPVEATLHLSLPSDSTGLPRGLRVDTDNFVRTSGGSQVVTDSVGSGSLVVRISDVKVDGVPLDVGPSCRVAKPAPIKLSGVGTPNFGAGQAVPPGTYNALFGGLLQGTLTIGSFSGCGNGSENLDPLVNSLGGNITAPVQIVQAQVNANCFNDNPRLALTASSCNRQGVLPYPAGSELPALLPSVAPAPPQDRNRVNPVDDSP